MTADEWIGSFARAVGLVPPDSNEVDILLELAGVAAHASERTAAPITCWLAALADLSPSEALAIANDLNRTGPA